MSLEEELKITAGNTLRHVGSRMKGTLGQTDIDEYEEVSPDGRIVAKYTVTESTDLRGKTNRSVRKY